MAEIVGARAIGREAVTTRIAAAALDLFDERGFAAVTMEDVARAAGVSVRSVHRYFPAKEDLIVGDPTPTAVLVEQAFAATDPTSPLWAALREALEPLVRKASADHANGRRIVRIIATTDTLRARNLEKHLTWAERLTPLVLARSTTGNAQRSRVQARTILHMALACFDVAIDTWANGDKADLSALLDEAFNSVVELQAVNRKPSAKTAGSQ